MPLYEYKCESCGSVFEVLQKFSDEPLTVHKDCGGPLERLISAPALQFKGSGWYITDYARSSVKSEGSDKTKSEGGSKESPKTEAKPSKPSQSKESKN